MRDSDDDDPPAAAGRAPEPSNTLSAYELERRENIRANQERLRALGFVDQRAPPRAARPPAQPRPPPAHTGPRRASERLQAVLRLEYGELDNSDDDWQ